MALTRVPQKEYKIKHKHENFSMPQIRGTECFTCRTDIVNKWWIFKKYRIWCRKCYKKVALKDSNVVK